jgi:L-ascorbate metabolism protein UlaG (beta-lactamase superfamily)
MPMSEQPTYRLDVSTCVAPLVQSWAAWWMTVAPVPASLHVRNYQLPLLKTYLQNPDFHARHIGIPSARAGEVKELAQKTQQAQAERIRLAEALESFQRLLLEEAKGQSMEPFYAKLPEPLRGRVELLYDYHGRPSLRVLEGMMYRGPCHQRELQSLRLLRLESDAGRPDLLTTPVLSEPGQLEWQVPFDDKKLDALFALDLEPRPLGFIQELLGLAAGGGTELLPLLTETPARPYTPWEGPGPRLRYLGHACVLIEWKGTTVLVDPVLSATPTAGGMPRLGFQDLPPRIDYVLITHSHYDHLSIETLLRLRHRIGQLVVPRASGLLVGDYSPKLLARSLGFERVLEPELYESLPLPDGEIVIAPFLGEHGDIGHAKSAYVVRMGEQQVLFAADSLGVDETLYRHMRKDLGPIQTVFMNTEVEGSPLTWTIEVLFPKKRDRKLEESRRCRGSNAAEALRMLEQLGATRLYNYAMGLEPWFTQIMGPPASPEEPRMKESERLMAAARARGLRAERLHGHQDLFLGE